MSPLFDSIDLPALTEAQRRSVLAARAAGSSELLAETWLAALAGSGDALRLRQAMAASPQTNPSQAVCWATENGREEALATALEAFEPQDFHPLAMSLAIERQAHGCVRLLARSAFSEEQCDALRRAAAQDNAEAVEILLATGVCPAQTIYSNNVPELGFQDPLCWAASTGSIRALRSLLRWREAHPFEAKPLGSALRSAAERGGSSDPAAQALCLQALIPLLSPRELLDELGSLAFDGAFEACSLILDSAPKGSCDSDRRGPIEILLEAAIAWADRAVESIDPDEWLDPALEIGAGEAAQAGLESALSLLESAVKASPEPLENGRFDLLKARSIGLIPGLADRVRGWRAQSEALALDAHAGGARAPAKKGPAL